MRVHSPCAEQTRAIRPDREAVLDRAGVRVRWESYGSGEPVILFLPTWSIVHSRCWKQQVADFARRHRVLTFDPRGNGGSGRPTSPAAYSEDQFASDALSVMDAAGVEQVVLVALSLGALRALIVAGEHPERVRGLVLIGPLLEVDEKPGAEQEAATRFTTDLGVDEGWDRYNSHPWRRDYRGFLEFFFSQVFTEPHSTKQIEDCVGWGLETGEETLIAAEVPGIGAARTLELCARVQCPVLVVHGDADAIVPHAIGVQVAKLARGRILTFAGSGHCGRRATLCGSTLRCGSSSARPRDAGHGGSGRARDKGWRCTCPRRSGLATSVVTLRSRTSCESSIPTLRSSGWRSIR
jgi:pimeloyl-ACP methyl ester carboxylesterase